MILRWHKFTFRESNGTQKERHIYVVHIYLFYFICVAPTHAGIDAEPADFAKSFDVNVTAYAMMAKICHPFMKNNGQGGKGR